MFIYICRLSIDNLKTEITNLRNKVNKVSQQVSAAENDIKQQMEEFLKVNIYRFEV